MIQTIEDIQRLVVAGETDWRQYGEVYVKEFAHLILFNYLPTAQYQGADWKPFELMSRGLIIDRHTGEIVARPFDKFFNYGEHGRFSTGALVSAAEKMDGSLGILYRFMNRPRIATRGSFTSEQATWATEWLNHHYPDHFSHRIPNELTLLFEIIYPVNRVVVDYGSRAEMVLLAARNRFNGEYLDDMDVDMLALDHRFNRPASFMFQAAEEVIAKCAELDANHEGFVVTFSDGQRFKMKGAKYLELHRLISSISFRNTLAAVAGGTLQTYLNSLPDEFMGDVRQWAAEIEQAVIEIRASVNAAFDAAPKESRKEFALWVQANIVKDRQPYMFAMLDNRPINPIIYKKLEDLPDRKAVVLEEG
jgi:RNA ligase